MLGCSTASFYGALPTDESLTRIRELGFSLCETFLNTFSEYQPTFVHELSRRAKACGLTVNSVHALPTEFEPQLFAHVRRQREDAFFMLERMMDICHELHAPIYVMHGKAMIHLGSNSVDSFGEYEDGFARIEAVGKKHGIQIALENVHWCMCNTPEFVSLLRAAAPGLGYTLDVKQAVMSGFAPEAYIKAMGDRLFNVHLCDCKQNRPCLPGEGTLDFPAIKKALADVGYHGNTIFEIYHREGETEEQLKKSIAFCRNIFS